MKKFVEHSFKAPPGKGFSQYAATWDELAGLMGVNRRTLQNAREKYAADAPRNRTDGRKPVAEWLAWANKHAVSGQGGEPQDDEREIRVETARLNLEERRWKFEKTKDQHLPVAQFEAALAVTLTNFNSALGPLPGRAAGKCLARARAAVLAALKAELPAKLFERVEKALSRDGAISFADVEEIFRLEVDLVKRTLVSCEYLRADGGAGDPADGADEEA